MHHSFQKQTKNPSYRSSLMKNIVYETEKKVQSLKLVWSDYSC